MNDTPADSSDDTPVELYGPDTGGWYTSRIHDWIGLSPLRDPDVRGYLILRALVIDKHDNRNRNLTIGILCQLIPGQVEGEPSSASRIRRMLTNLSDIGLVSTPEGGPIKTSSRASAMDKTLRIRINDRPKEGYTGWRNVEVKLKAILAQASAAEAPAPEPEPAEDLAEAGSKSNPVEGAGSIRNPLGSIRNPLGSESNPHLVPDQGKRDPHLGSYLGSSLSQQAGEPQQAAAASEDEREGAPQKDHKTERTPVDAVVEAYVMAHIGTVGLPPRPHTVKKIRGDAAGLLAAGRTVQHLEGLAADLAHKGWDDLVKHLAKNPEPGRAAAVAAAAKPWCGQCPPPGHPDHRWIVPDDEDQAAKKCACFSGKALANA